MSAAMRRVVAGVIAFAMLWALCACSTRASEWTTDTYEIAGGGATGVYYAYGTQLASDLSASLDVHMVAQKTAGSVDNLMRVGSGKSLLGFAQGDAAADAVAGVGAFDHALPIEAIARLYDEYVHVVVRADSNITGIAGLAGKRMSLGAESSGVNLIAKRVLDAASVDVGSIDNPQFDLAGSIGALKRGEIDGFFWVGGIPTPGIADLAGQIPVRLLPIERSWVNTVNERYSDAYRPSELPVGLYGLEDSEPTMAVPNYLVTSSSTPASMVRDILTGLFDARARIGRNVQAAALLDRRQAIFTGPVPLHPGAIEYYRDQRG